MTTRFRLAPMSMAIWITSIVCFATPVVMVAAVRNAPAPARTVIHMTAAAVVVIYAFIGLWMRPTGFVVGPDDLEVAWPLRRRRIPRAAITRARVMSMTQLRHELGYVLRVGAGGLWGGFGRARTAKGMLELWVTRTDRIVYLECDGRHSLLVTPADPDRFASLVTSR